MFKFNSKYSKILTMMLVILIVAIVGLAGYFAYDMMNASAINTKAESVVDEFEKSTESVKKTIKRQETANQELPDIDTSTEVNPIMETTETTSTEVAQTSTETTSNAQVKAEKKYLEGFEVLGTINIPKTKCKYPILNQVTKKSLETAVAVLYPIDAELNVDNNVTIVGHNYRNNLFFSNNYKLREGDTIEITSPYEKVTYVIYDYHYLEPSDASYMQRDIPEGVREIALSTCNDDSSQRLVILAREQGK